MSSLKPKSSYMTSYKRGTVASGSTSCSYTSSSASYLGTSGSKSNSTFNLSTSSNNKNNNNNNASTSLSYNSSTCGTSRFPSLSNLSSTDKSYNSFSPSSKVGESGISSSSRFASKAGTGSTQNLSKHSYDTSSSNATNSSSPSGGLTREKPIAYGGSGTTGIRTFGNSGTKPGSSSSTSRFSGVRGLTDSATNNSGTDAKKPTGSNITSSIDSMKFEHPPQVNRVSTKTSVGGVSSSGSSTGTGTTTGSLISTLRTNTTTSRIGLRVVSTPNSHYGGSMYQAAASASSASSRFAKRVVNESSSSSPPIPNATANLSNNESNSEKCLKVKLMSRGTSPAQVPLPSFPKQTQQQGSIKDAEISVNEEHIKTIELKVDASNSSVTKNKEIQTDEQGTKQSIISSIPRPSTTYYSPFNSALSRFTSPGPPNNETTTSTIKRKTDASSSSMINSNKNMTNDQSRASSCISSRGSSSPLSASSSSSSINKPSSTTGTRAGTTETTVVVTGKEKQNINTSLSHHELHHHHYNKNSSINNGNFPQQVENTKNRETKRPPTDPSKSTPQFGYSTTMRKCSTGSSNSNILDLDHKRRGSSCSSTSVTSSSASSRSNSCERTPGLQYQLLKPRSRSGSSSSIPEATFTIKLPNSFGQKMKYTRKSPVGDQWWGNKASESDSEYINNTGTVIRKKLTVPVTEKPAGSTSESDTPIVCIKLPKALPNVETTLNTVEPPKPALETETEAHDEGCSDITSQMEELFISEMRNIDEILGTMQPPVSPSPFQFLQPNVVSASVAIPKSDSEESENSDVDDKHDDDDDCGSIGTSSSFEEIDPNDVKIHYPELATSAFKFSVPEANPEPESEIPKKLDDATLQIYKDGDYGTYLDIEASISEQQEEFESFLSNRKNSIVLRAQLPVRVNAIIEKLLNADGRELRRALFSLKQIFQEDKDLVHEFVENGGLSCLIKVGSEADQNYQNYILRALGQVMLYVDGMYGVMRHNETIQWLYKLVASKFRLVQKTALKLLLVFVEYVETNCLLLVEAVSTVDSTRGLPYWTNVMNLLKEHESSGDTELLVYAMTLVNKVLNGIPDIDTYYDQVDALEEQGMANLIQKYMGKQCVDLDLLQQLQIYEVVLKHEDGEEDIMMQLDESMRQKLMNRKGYIVLDNSSSSPNLRKERRKSRRHSANSANGSSNHPTIRRLSSTEDTTRDDWSSNSSEASSSSHSSSPAPSIIPTSSPSPIILNGFSTSTKDKYNETEVTPGLRRRRERSLHLNGTDGLHLDCNGHVPPTGASDLALADSPNLLPLGRCPSSPKDLNSIVNGSPETKSRSWLPNFSIPTKEPETQTNTPQSPIVELKRENTVKDLTQKLTNGSNTSSSDESKSVARTGDLSGIISKAKEGLAKSKSKADLKPQQQQSVPENPNLPQNQKSDNELHWDFLVRNLSRPLEICDLDFTGLKSDDDIDIISPHQLCNISIPPPLPASPNGSSEHGPGPAPPPPPGKFAPLPPKAPIAPLFGVSLKHSAVPNSTESLVSKNNSKKTKKTVKLFWREVREDPVTLAKTQNLGSIWDELVPVPLDTQKLESLFESRAKDIINKKHQEVLKFKEIVVLDPKRSNAINIGMTKLPPPRTIKTAILKMDSTIINREGIEKLLTMLPTDEERAKIQEAQFANPEIPLGNAEQFLLTLASISELTARLKLWAFKLDYENLEKEVAEPLMDLKLGIEGLQNNKTFRSILTTLLCIGNFLNGVDAKGFQIEYLAKVPEVKDTVHKHSLLHHLCTTVIEKFPESTDLYSEIGAVTRASRVDFDELATNLAKMESDCKASWDYLRLIAKHDGPTNMKLKMSEFLADCAERIIVLGIIHRRVVNRFYKFLLWLGVPAHQVTTTKPHLLFKIISEFALEYRTTRDRVLQQIQKKANHRERNKTRGKMITEQILTQYKTMTKEDRADEALRQVLNNNNNTSALEGGDGTTLTLGRRPKVPYSNNAVLQNNFHNRTISRTGSLGDGNDDEILESLVKTATQTPATRTAPRERKRNSNPRYSERKSLRRTLRHGLSEEERRLLAAFMANGHTF